MSIRGFLNGRCAIWEHIHVTNNLTREKDEDLSVVTSLSWLVRKIYCNLISRSIA